MRIRSSVLLGCLLSATARAQTPSQPTLILTIFGGVSSGNNLWAVARQPVCVLNTADDNCSPAFDTLRLTRDVTSSLLVGAGATYFTGPHLGYTAEVFYLGLPLDDGCSGILFNPDPGADPSYGGRNEQMCNSITAAALSTSAIAFLAGLTYRLAPSRGLSPYVRGSLGVVTYPTGTVELSGDFFQNNRIRSRAVIADEHPKQIAFGGQIAAGMTARLGPGYQFRFELRDVFVPLDRVTGPAVLASNLVAPVRVKVYQHFALTLGLDVVLEKKRGRRY